MPSFEKSCLSFLLHPNLRWPWGVTLAPNKWTELLKNCSKVSQKLDGASQKMDRASQKMNRASKKINGAPAKNFLKNLLFWAWASQKNEQSFLETAFICKK